MSDYDWAWEEEEAWIREQEEMAGLAAPAPPAPVPVTEPEKKAPPMDIDLKGPAELPAEEAPAPAAKEIELSPEQRAVLRHVMQGKNVYFTGSAGCGKSTLLREIIKRAPKGETFITASTGMAALNIGGTTIHSFAGIGLGEGSLEMLIDKALGGKSSRANWEAVRVLIIDEISMVHGSLLSKLEAIARAAKHNQAPFGGIQLVVTGDFFQLPPVQKDRKRGAQQDFCFSTPIWETLFPEGCCFELSTIFRQAEYQLQDLLQDVRYGRVSTASMQLLRFLSRDIKPPNGIMPTLLYSTNFKVDEINMQQLNQLPGEIRTYTAQDGGQEPFLSSLRKHCLADDNLKLKVGAQVMLIKNLDQSAGLVNGSKGCVIAFKGMDDGDEEDLDGIVKPIKPDGTKYPLVRFANGIERLITYEEWSVEQPKKGKVEKVARRSQVPLKLGWAITIHKSQGMGLDWVRVSLSAAFEEGQCYVALSRATKLEGLQVTDFNPSLFKVSPLVVTFYDRKIKGRSRKETTPESTWQVAHWWSKDYAGREVRPSPGFDRYRRGGGGGGGGGYKRPSSFVPGPFDDWNSQSTKRPALQQLAGRGAPPQGPSTLQQPGLAKLGGLPPAQTLASESHAAAGPWGGWNKHAPPANRERRATPGGGHWAMYSERRNLPVYNNRPSGGGSSGGYGR